MEKLRVRSGESNGSGKNPIMPLHNALGIENWPQYVQDEHARLLHRKGNFIPVEELLVADFDGRPWLSDDQVYSQDQEERLAGYEKGTAVFCRDENAGDEDLLDTPEKIQAYYRFLYPWLFFGKVADDVRPGREPSQPNFHGITRQNITPKTNSHAEPNSKRKKRIKYLPDRRGSIRTAHFNELAEGAVEMAAE